MPQRCVTTWWRPCRPRRSPAIPAYNLLINGSCAIDQVNEGATYTLPVDGSQTAHSPDGWEASAYSLASGLTLRRHGDAPPGQINSVEVAIGTGAAISRTNDGLILFQNLNASQIGILGFGTSAPAAFYVGFWIKTHLVSGTFCFAMQNGMGGRGYVTEFSVPSPDVWTYITLGPIPGDSYGSGTPPFVRNTSAATATGNDLTFSSTSGVLVGAMVTGTNIQSAPPTFVDAVTSTTVELSQNVLGTVASGAAITFSPPWTPVPTNNIQATFTITLAAGTGFRGISGMWQTTPPLGVGNGGSSPLSTAAQTAQLLTASGAYARVSGLSLSPYKVSSPVQEDPAINLVRCSNFLQKSYDQGIAVGTAGANMPITWFEPMTGTISPSIYVPFSQKLLLYPATITVYSATTGAAGKVHENGSGLDVNATVTNLGTAGFTLSTTAPIALTAGSLIQFHWLAEAQH